MGIGKTLSDVLKEKGINANELAERLGITPSTIYSIIKRDNMKVDITVLASICKELDVNMERFYDEYVDENQRKQHEPFSFSMEEKRHIKKYRSLDRFGKKAVDASLDIEYERCTSRDTVALEGNEQKLINQYRQCDENGKKVIGSVIDMASTVDVYRAACSEDDHTDEIIKMSKAELERLQSLPMTDEEGL